MMRRLFKSPTRPATATLVGIFIATAAGRPMTSVPRAQAVAGAGLAGDRYGENAGFWKATDACQVTLITEQELDQTRTRDPDIKARLATGHHRRNLVIHGLNIKQLQGRRFRIGTAIFQCVKPRPPCGYLDQIEGAGMCKALGRNSGVCLRVIDSGSFAVGDTITLLDGSD